MMKATDFPRLVGDIGGTNARFAVVAASGASPTHLAVLPCREHASLRDAVVHYLAGLYRTGLPRPRWAALGIANPVVGDEVRMTNHAWGFSAAQLRRDLGLERLLLLNDFTALALGVPALRAQAVRQFGGGAPVTPGAIAVLGPGTGLGVSGLIPAGASHIAIAGEGGHATLPASHAEEAAVLAVLAARFGHVSAERVLSGPGIVNLHMALAAVRGLFAPVPIDAAEVTARAAGGDALCAGAVAMFSDFLGTVAADTALLLGAVGGVYLGGGIVPALGDAFFASGFRSRFEAKGRFSAYLSAIPVFVMRSPELCALAGASRALDGERKVLGSLDMF